MISFWLTACKRAAVLTKTASTWVITAGRRAVVLTMTASTWVVKAGKSGVVLTMPAYLGRNSWYKSFSPNYDSFYLKSCCVDYDSFYLGRNSW